MSDTTLGSYYSLNKLGIDPRFYPDEPFYYYNLPDFDTGEEVALSIGKSIDSNKFLVQQESLLISKLNPRIKRVWLVRNDGRFRSISSTEFVNLIPNDTAVVDYLFYFLQQDWLFRKLESEAVGTTNSHVRFKPDLLCRIPGELPSTTQQRKIARILTTVDNLIEKTEALIAKHQAIKQGMMHDLFTRGVDEHGHLRPRHEEAPELYKQSELGWIPREWEVGVLGDEIGQLASGWSPICDSVPAAPNEWAILKTTAVVWDGYDENENKRLPAGYTPIASIEVKPDDILITRKGPVERVGVVVHVPDTRSRLMIPDTVFRVRLLDSSTVLPSFVPLTLGCEVVQRDWFGRKVGLADAQVNVNHGILRQTQFPKPTNDEQHRIVERVAKARVRIQLERRNCSKLAEVKSGLMQNLLTGKVRVNVDEFEEVAASA